MPVRIKVAERPEELDALFHARHRARGLDPDLRLPGADTRLMDRFDAFASTRNLLALHGDQPAGGLRLCLPGALGAPLDAPFEFATALPAGAAPATLSRAFVLAPFDEGEMRLFGTLLRMAAALAREHGVGFLVACLQEDFAEIAISLGFLQAGRPLRGEGEDRALLPLILGLERAERCLPTPSQSAFVPGSPEQAEWEHYRAGERVIRAGTEGSAAYLVVSGEVTVLAERAETGGHGTLQLARLGPGQVFGELALLTSRPRSADVIAVGEVDLMVLERAAFRRALSRHPDQVPAILEQLAERLANANDLLCR